MNDIEKLRADVDKIAAAMNGAGITITFGPYAPTGGDGEDQSGMMPGEGVTADGKTPLPWNQQAGEAGRQVFRGPTDIPLVPPPGFNGHREVSISQTAPQYDSVSAKLDGDPTELAGGHGGTFNVFFAEGAPRVLHVVPNPGQVRGPKQPVPCGHIAFVGGIPGQ